MKRLLAAVVAVVALTLGWVGWQSRTPAPTLPQPASQGAGPRIDVLIAGGGGTPDQNQVSIEDDLLGAQRAIPGQAKTLYAGGPGSPSVQVLSEHEPDELLTKLGAIFLPAVRQTDYREPRIVSDGPATRQAILEGLTDLVRPTEGVATFYFAGHGDMGATPRENIVSTWGNDVISVDDLVSTLNAHQARPIRMAMTSCFSGGFSDIIFSEPLPETTDTAFKVRTDRCGVFASTWDLEAGGCDPDPNRGKHEGFGVHFVAALKGQDRDGKTLDVDLNKDGGVSLLEAFTQARIASGSIDVPTCTSERFLRAALAQEELTGIEPLALPEEARVIEALSLRLNLRSFDEAEEAFAGVQLQLTGLQDRADAAAQAESAAFRRIVGDLMARWPALADPWHREFYPTLQRDRDAILKFLETSDTYKEYTDAVKKSEEIADEIAEIQVRSAPLERLVRAHENQYLAAQLKANQPANWKYFEALRACENAKLSQ